LAAAKRFAGAGVAQGFGFDRYFKPVNLFE
jgi:hypothetical protein